MTKRLLTLFVISMVSFLMYGQEDDVVKKGQQAPDFTYSIENNKTAKLSDFKGKVVLINFFATWCGPCMTEMPLLQEKIWMKYKGNDKFKLMSFGREHSWEEVKSFIETKKFDFPIYPDKDKSIYSKFANKYIPRNYVVDKNGVIVYVSMGFSELEFGKMVEFIDTLLNTDK